ncbi:Lantibiotic dehydratase, C terminus [Chitinophaga eiseniae]|uniref:Lantibiotic dehydratase, C terminus n=1 Tax=Chitinophaga eiseniae TaxID=634771 RepID=A0A1T4MF16_9BACT|nr:lantibiotic dehydratase [Chitinophaga eiseniae]SJZ65368.1 Lantibiotic dehydratase, C terminus [Chitinophaga eiseniae]
MTLKVFPYALVRYAAMPFPALKALEITETDACLAAADIAAQDFRQQQERLCELLFQAIQSAADDDTRQLLLRWKRAVYNGRKPPEETVEYLSGPMLRYRESLMQQQKDREAWQVFYNRQLQQHRRQLQAWSGEEALRKGILLSSPVLYGQLDHFAEADPAAFKARELKNEYSLLRYITRMAAKTSPFSTFTYTGVSTMQTATDTAPAIISNVRLNNSLFTYLRSLLVHHPVLNELMTVTLNDTVTMDETHLHFLVNYFNVEAFQRLPARSVALWLYQRLTAPGTLAALIDTLAGEMPGVPREQIKAFLLKLSASGLLELGIGCSGIDPEWDRALTDFLSGSTQHMAAKALRELLLVLQVNRGFYAVADVATRARLLETCAAALNAVLHQLKTEAALPDSVTTSAADAAFEVHHFAPRSFQPADIFYEDTSTSTVDTLPEEVQALTEKAERFCALLAGSDLLQEERDRMRDFFLRQYDVAQRPAVTDFYHAYYLHVKKQQHDTGGITVMDIPETIQLVVKPDVVDVFGQATMPAAPLSRGMFVQLFYPETTAPLMGVVNAFLPGMGKVAGRFLHLFDPAVTDTFRSWNTALQPGHLMIELNDGSVFNANIHPPLLAHEITIPGGSNNYPPEKRISLKDIVVQYDPVSRRLELWHTVRDKPVYTFDLCLESFYNRSHFYRLLAHFNPETRVPLRSFIAAADHRYALHYAAAGPVQPLPRIVFEDRLVLRRRGWLVSTAAVPVPAGAETDAEYFLRLQRWRIAEKLPQHVFVFLKSPYLQVAAKKGQLHRDDYKPQYISFVQPLLVAVFRKMLSRAGEQLYLEEVLPDVSEHGTVTEHMLHWYQY